MARIYALNEKHNCDYGVDFINGVAVVPDADTKVIAWFTAHGYTVVPGSDTLSPWDELPVAAWVDTDTYNKGAAAKYTFTATLGALPLPFANTAAVTATVEVEVKA